MENKIDLLKAKKKRLLQEHGIKSGLGFIVLNEGIARIIKGIDGKIAMLQKA